LKTYPTLLASFLLAAVTLGNVAAYAASADPNKPVGAYFSPESAKSSADVTSKLTGHWQSEQDATYKLTIKGKQFLESHSGEAMPDQTFEYQAHCKSFDAAVKSCLLVKGQSDATYYAIVNNDAEHLELSIIGGMGNTLKFKRIPSSPVAAVTKGCKAVQFKKGELAAVVEGTTAEGKTDCYTVKTGANQTMTAELIGNSDDIKNTAITIPGIGDVRDTFQFKTEKKTYEIHISQIKGVAEKKPYGLNITVY
jgi:hypothetical protein